MQLKLQIEIRTLRLGKHDLGKWTLFQPLPQMDFNGIVAIKLEEIQTRASTSCVAVSMDNMATHPKLLHAKLQLEFNNY